MGKNLVLIGAGHAHLTCLTRVGDFVARGHRVTVIGPGTHHYYSGMGPGMLGQTYRPQEIRFNSRKMAEAGGARFIKGLVVRVDPDRRRLLMASGEEIPYDVVSFNIGSGIPTAEVVLEETANVFTVKPIEQLLCARQSILEQLRQKSLELLVVGGGPAGVEISGNLQRLVKRNNGTATVTLVAGRRLLANLPDPVRQRVFASFQRRDIRVIEGPHLTEVGAGKARLTDGRELPFDFLFLALGVRPPRLFQDSGLPTGPDGGLLVNEFLQSVAHPEMFGGGDCIYFQPQPLDKVGVYAVRQNPLLRDNLMAALAGGTLKPFQPGGAYLLIFNMGDGRGIFRKKNVVFDGRLAFFLKDYIDRRFMRKFQISGELNEV
jgi:NADH dehydrogenase FAD-containing subunit|uniref:Pyridine nucleotide-disulfide oxidoreductase n=1 Tax=Desulfobacca acetoxidans TaxID=60893 RepID=A0A7V6DPJ7_9BACT